MNTPIAIIRTFKPAQIRGLTRLAVYLIPLVLISIPFYSSLSASLSKGSPGLSSRSLPKTSSGPARTRKGIQPLSIKNMLNSSSLPSGSFLAPLATETIETFAADCTTPPQQLK